jgi:hypothetical protein
VGFSPSATNTDANVRRSECGVSRSGSSSSPSSSSFAFASSTAFASSRRRTFDGISTFAEVQLKDVDGKLSIPDGAIVVERGKTRWRCLVEVKTSMVALKPDQVARYLDMAREHEFDAVLTISNQITASPRESPVTVDRRKLRSVSLFHLSWWRVITEAIVQHRFRGIDNPDQAWILGELIAYIWTMRSRARPASRTWARAGSRFGTPPPPEHSGRRIPRRAR